MLISGDKPPVYIALDALALALLFMGALTTVGAYQEFTRSLHPDLLAVLFFMFSAGPPLLLLWCMFRYSKSNGSLLKDLVSLVSAILLLLAGLAVLLFPIYFDTYNRAASLGRIYVEEHTEIIAADALAMAIDLNRELSGVDVIDDRIVETQTALRSLSVGLLLRQDGTIVARHSPGPDLSEQQLDRYIAEARKVVSKATEVTEDAVICIVKLDIAVAEYLLVARFINEDAIADWRRTQNLVGGPHQSFLFWVVLAVLALLIASTLGIWWFVARSSRREQKNVA